MVVLQRFRIELVHRWQVHTEQFHAILLQPYWDLRCDHGSSIWKNCRVAPSAGPYQKSRGCGDLFAVWPEILDGDQMLLLQTRKKLREIDYGCAAEINFERRFFDSCPICVEMEPRIRVRAVVHAHRDRAEIHAGALRDLVC